MNTALHLEQKPERDDEFEMSLLDHFACLNIRFLVREEDLQPAA